MPPESPASDVDRLYGLPLEHFVPERDALARTLRQAGRREEAAEVKALTKPSLPAWALNQLAHGRPEEVVAFLAAAERLEAAQGALLRGGDRASWRAAADDLAGATERLLALARGLSDDRSRPLSAATLDRVRTTLQAVPGDPEARELLRRGRLDREREPPGFGGALLAGAPVSPPEAPAEREPRPARKGERAPRRDAARGGERGRGRDAAPTKGRGSDAARAREADEERRRAAEAERARQAEAARRAETERERARQAEAARRTEAEREAARQAEARARSELAAAEERVAEAERDLSAARAERDRRREALVAARRRRAERET